MAPLKSRRCTTTILLLACALASTGPHAHAQSAAAPSGSDSDWPDLADLARIEVTTASKRATPLNQTTAAVSVLTGAEILRTGATTIPNALRYAPGVDVGQIQSFSSAVSARGFNGQFANLLLVMVDGRSVYNMTFGGVLWATVDIFPEDLDRIEIVRGPGGALWGANAVNGVINILTKDARDTQGTVSYAGAGQNAESFGGARTGFKISDHTFGRVYAKYAKYDGTAATGGNAYIDRWRRFQGGFRIDHHPSADTHLTVQGDAYQTDTDNPSELPVLQPPYHQLRVFDTRFIGANLLARWERSLSATSTLTAQTYWDFSETSKGILPESTHTFDLELQHTLQPTARHTLTYGVNGRIAPNTIGTSPILVVPGRESVVERRASVFAQDEIELQPEMLFLSLGAKAEWFDLTGWTFAPSIRLRWQPAETLMFWAAASRAGAVPARVKTDSIARTGVMPPGSLGPESPAAYVVSYNRNKASERLNAWELGSRFQPTTTLSIDLAAFLGDYSHLGTTEYGTPELDADPPQLPVYWQYTAAGRTCGTEVQITWQPLSCWRLEANYSWFWSNAVFTGLGQLDRSGSPRHKATLRSSLNLGRHWMFDAGLRYVDQLEAGNIPAYLAFDLQVAWAPSQHWEVALVGRNLTDPHHREFVSARLLQTLNVPRTLYAKVTWRY